MTDRRAIFILLGALLVYALATFTPWSGQAPDANGYYRWASSLIFDGDWGMAHDFVNCGYAADHIIQDLADILPSGNHPNAFSLGPGLIWSTALAPFAAVERAIHGAEWWQGVDAYSFRYRLLISLVTLAIGCHAVILLFHCLREFFSTGVSLAVTLLTALGSSFPHYLTVEPAMSHVHVFWAVTILWWLTIRLWKAEPERSRWEDLALGMAVGLTTLMRWQAVLWAVLPGAVYIAQMMSSPKRGRVMLGALVATAGSLAVFSPQFLAWKTLYGSWIVIPQGQGFLFNPDQKLALIEVLFSRWNGLFTCHPWLLLGIPGLILFSKRAPSLAIGGCLALGGMWIVNSSVHDWWAGDSFGARRWCNALPAFALGTAALLAAIPKQRPRAIIAAALVVLWVPLNVLLILLYHRGVVREDWMGNLPLFGEIIPVMLADPKQWLVGIVGSSILWPNDHPRLALSMAALIACAVLPFAAVLFTKAAPWHRRGVAKVVMGAFVFQLVIAFAVGLWAMGRSPHPDVHLRIDEAIDPFGPLDQRWASINHPGFALDHTCPVHLAIAGHLALVNGDEEQGVALVQELEAIYPRMAHLLIIRHSLNEETRRAAIQRVLENPRLGDDHHLNGAVLAALEIEDFELFHALAQIPTLSHLVLAEGERQFAEYYENAEAQEHHLRVMLRRRPDDFDVMVQLADLREAVGDLEEAERIRQTATLWCEVKLRIMERLSSFDPHLFGILKGPEASHWCRARLRLIDPLSDADLYEETIERARVMLEGHRHWADIERDMLYDMLDVVRRDPPDSMAAQLMQWFGEQVRKHSGSLEHWEVLIESAGLIQGTDAAVEHLATAIGRFPSAGHWNHTMHRAVARIELEDFSMISLETWPPDAQGWALLGLAHRADELRAYELGLELTVQAKMRGLDIAPLASTAHHFMVQSWLGVREVENPENLPSTLALLREYSVQFPEDHQAQEAIDEVTGMIVSSENREGVETATETADIAP